MAGDPAALRSEAERGRRRPARRSSSLRATARLGRGHRRPRLPVPGRADGGAAARKGPRRTFARRRELRGGAHGALGPPGEPRALAEAVCNLLEDEPARVELGRAARVLAQERYSWEGIAQRLSEIYGGIVESQRAFAA